MVARQQSGRRCRVKCGQAIAAARHLLRPGCGPTGPPRLTPVAAVVEAAASPTIPVPVSARVLVRLQARQLDLSRL